MKILDITNYIEQLAPLDYAENFDNVGLLIGDHQTEVTGILVTLDTIEETVDEAIKNKCNLIVSFHPIIFNNLKKINKHGYVERVIFKAIENKIAIYATHTALDKSFNGVNSKICEILQLEKKEMLIPQKNTIKKLTVYCPVASPDLLRKSLSKINEESIGDYSFNTEKETEKEIKLTVTFPKHLEKIILKELFKIHPHEKINCEMITLENENQKIGMGMIGELKNPMNSKNFLEYVKSKMKTPCIRHTKFIKKPIKKIAVLGGSGSFAIDVVLKKKIDAYLTSDLKYHDFYKAQQQILIADIGHYESEQFTKNLLVNYLKNKFRKFPIFLPKRSTNPVFYL